MFLPEWAYDGTDPGLKLFTLANPLLPSMAGDERRVFEIGASDTDWIERVQALRPSWKVAGVDWRPTGCRFVVRADVLTMTLPVCDVFVGLSSIEHVGLGHYDMDPLDAYGDVKAVQRLREHLLPGGFLYLDVPYAPEGYWVKGTKCRIYDDQALSDRFGPHQVLGYTMPSVDGWIDKPVTNHEGPSPYYYVALVIQKGHA